MWTRGYEVLLVRQTIAELPVGADSITGAEPLVIANYVFTSETDAKLFCNAARVHDSPRYGIVWLFNGKLRREGPSAQERKRLQAAGVT